MNDNEGMRIVRGKGQRAKVSTQPSVLAEVAQGAVVLIAVRVGAHLAGPAKGPLTTVLCRCADVATGLELYRCGDLVIAHSQLVTVWNMED